MHDGEVCAWCGEDATEIHNGAPCCSWCYNVLVMNPTEVDDELVLKLICEHPVEGRREDGYCMFCCQMIGAVEAEDKSKDEVTIL